MATKGSLTEWLRENHKEFGDKESLVLGASAVYPDSARKTVLNRISDLVRNGELPQGLVEQRDTAAKSSAGKRPKKDGGKRVPKKFRMAVDASLVRDEWDDEAKIDEGLTNLDGQVIKDNDFRTELGVAQDRWKSVSASEKYSENKIELKGKAYRGVYWGHKDVIVTLRKKVDMV